MRPKIIAMYLPQFHRIPENDLWWGEGFTDWVSAKTAKPLFEGHKQPKEPLNDNYYDLSHKEDLKWQINLAREYGIDGFCMYHYWFSSDKILLEKPAEILLENKELGMPFCFAWDNTSWIRTWSKLEGNAWSPNHDKEKDSNYEGVLARLDYGTENDWRKHFDYLLPFFKDSRYIKRNNKPVFIFFTNKDVEVLKKMALYWEQLAKESGLAGLYLITRSTPFNKNKLFNGTFQYEPIFSGWQRSDIIRAVLKRKKNALMEPRIYSYDKIWNRILKRAIYDKSEDAFSGAFVGYDDTPRRGKKGRVVLGATPEKFRRYLNELYKRCKEKNKEFIFLTAWNEWGEGAVLEPDKMNEYEYLIQIRKIKEDN